MAARSNRRRYIGTRKKSEVVLPLKPRGEATSFLNDGQFAELCGVIDRLEDLGNERELWDLDIVRVGRIWKLVHTGTSLGGIVADVYFGHVHQTKKVVVLGIYPGTDAIDEPWYRAARMEQRLAHYIKIGKFA
jgi:hypothetical protein